MSVTLLDSPDDERQDGGIFYRCDDVTRCGLRFPVTVTDPFQGRCPRCGGPVRTVAHVEVREPSVVPFHSNLGQSSINIYLLLDNWRSLFNVGAAFRSADGAGVRHLYLCGITATPDRQRKLAKTALGAERAVTWSYHADAVKLAVALRSAGAELWVLESGANATQLFKVSELPLASDVVLVAGNEVVGVDPELLAMADRVICLPMAGIKRSLNVAVALSIATYFLHALPGIRPTKQNV